MSASRIVDSVAARVIIWSSGGDHSWVTPVAVVCAIILGVVWLVRKNVFGAGELFLRILERVTGIGGERDQKSAGDATDSSGETAEVSAQASPAHESRSVATQASSPLGFRIPPVPLPPTAISELPPMPAPIVLAQPLPPVPEPTNAANVPPTPVPAAVPVVPPLPVLPPPPAPPIVDAVPVGSATSSADDDLDQTRVVPLSAEWQIALADRRVLSVGSAMRLGRDPIVDPADRGVVLVPLADPARSLSKTHAQIEARPGELLVTDLHSTNGTAVIMNGLPTALAPGRAFAVTADAELRLGDYVVQVRREASAARG